MAEGDLRWKYNAGGVIRSAIITDSNGVIYFGNESGNVFAVNSDGTLKWKFTGYYGGSPYGEFSAGIVLSNDESVVYAIDAGWKVYAIYTATGNEKWNYTAKTPGYSGIVIDTNDNLYIGGWCCSDGLFSLDSDSNLRWTLGGDECHSGHAIGKSDTVIYYLDVDFGLREVALSDGTINWTHPGVTWGCYGTGISIASDGTIYYGDCGYFYAVNSDGSAKWNFAVGSASRKNNAVGSNNNIWFVDSNGVNTKVYVVTPLGVEIWHYDIPNWVGAFGATGLALDSNDTVFVGCHDYKLYTINSDGSLRWTYTSGNKIQSGITFSSSEDTVYFGSDDGYVYAIEKIPSAPTCGIVAVGDKVMLCPIGNQHGNVVALKSGNAAVSHKSLIASVNNQAALKLDFRSCNTKQGDKVICVPISGAKRNILGLR